MLQCDTFIQSKEPAQRLAPQPRRWFGRSTAQAVSADSPQRQRCKTRRIWANWGKYGSSVPYSCLIHVPLSRIEVDVTRWITLCGTTDDTQADMWRGHTGFIEQAFHYATMIDLRRRNARSACLSTGNDTPCGFRRRTPDKGVFWFPIERMMNTSLRNQPSFRMMPMAPC